MWGIHDLTRLGGPSGCGVYRVTMPFDELKRNGWDMGYGAGEPADPQAHRVIVGQRIDKPDSMKRWRRWRAHSRLVYEIDDDLWHVPVTNWMAHPTFQKLEVLDAVETGMMLSNLVTVSTEPLAELARQFNPEVRVIPNFIPGELLTWNRYRPRVWQKRKAKEITRVVIGWRGGGSHTMDVAVIARPVCHVLEHNPRAELHMVGDDFRETIGAPLNRTRFTNWVPIDASNKYFRSLLDWDIALAPLAGTRFDQSKSNLAALEPAALGIPVLASDCEPYRGFVQHGKTGYLIRKPSEWGKRMQELINDDAARAEMGAAAREAAKAWTIESGWKQWAAVYEELS